LENWKKENDFQFDKLENWKKENDFQLGEQEKRARLSVRAFLLVIFFCLIKQERGIESLRKSGVSLLKVDSIR